MIKLHRFTKIKANDVNVISIDRSKLDLSKDACLWYHNFYSCRDINQLNEHKNAPHIYLSSN